MNGPDAKSTQELEEPDEGIGLDLRVLGLYAVGRSRVWVAVCLVLGGAAAALYAFSLPNTYTSEGRLRLTAGKRETLTPETSAGFEDASLPPAMADELLLLTGESVFRATAEVLGPRRVLRPDDPRRRDDEGTPLLWRWQHQIQATILAGQVEHLDDPDVPMDALVDAAAKVLRANSVIWPQPSSSVISVRVTGTSPESARDFTTALMQRCIEEHRRAYAIGSYVETNKAKRQTVEGELREVEQAYDEHIDQCGFVSLRTQMETLIDEVISQERALDELRADHAGKKARHQALMASLAKLPRRIEQERQPMLGPNDEVEILKRERRDLLKEQWRVINAPGTDKRSQEHYEQYFKEQVAALDAELAQLPRIVEVMPASTEEVPNPEFEILSRTAIELEAEVEGHLRRIERLETSLEARRSRLDAARTCEPIHSRLQRQLHEKESTLLGLAQTAGELELLELLEEQGDSNLRNFQPATLPREKDGPKRLRMLLVGLLAGGGLGLVIAVLRQLLDGRVRYRRTLQRELRLEVLAALPELKGLPRPAFHEREAEPRPAPRTRAAGA